MTLSPILVEAVSFLFDEGKKFLQERQACAEASQSVTAVEPEIASKPSAENAQLSENITSKEVALNQKVPESLWTTSEAKVEHLTRLLEIYTRNLLFRYLACEF